MTRSRLRGPFGTFLVISLSGDSGGGGGYIGVHINPSILRQPEMCLVSVELVHPMFRLTLHMCHFAFGFGGRPKNGVKNRSSDVSKK